MRKEEVLRILLVTIASDDYESITHIQDRVQRFAGEMGFNWTLEDIELELRDQESKGLMSAFSMSAQQPNAVKTTLRGKELSKLWFYSTALGRSLAVGIDELRTLVSVVRLREGECSAHPESEFASAPFVSSILTRIR